jgi:arylsulfatase A-like enzyme
VLAGAALVLVMAAVTWRLGRGGPQRLRGGLPGATGVALPAAIRIEEPVADLVTRFAPAAVAEEPSPGAVRLGRLQPGSRLGFNRGHRRAVVAPPPSRWQARVHVRPGAVLRFGIGVERDRDVEHPVQAIVFAVRADGREVFAHVLEPAGRRGDRRWLDVRIDLGDFGDRPVSLEFQTRAIGTGTKPAGIPGWSHVRVVTERSRRRQPSSTAAPSVVVLLVDTLRADRLGCYGATPSPSPVLDALAGEGLLVEQALSQSSWTLPSVASILTGRHPRSHGVVGADFHRRRRVGAETPATAPEARAEARGDPSYLADAFTTLAEAAQDAGMTTVGVSTNPLVSRETNLAQGFEEFLELPDAGEGAWASAAQVNAAFRGWLGRNAGHRFFAYLHYMDVHGPYKPPRHMRPSPAPGLRQAVVAGEIDRVQKSMQGPGGPLSPAELEHLRRLYDAGIRAWDAELARLLDDLEAAGVAERTVVVVTSDHGEGFLEHGRLKHGTSLYDELIRVPLILRGPGVPAGRLALQGQAIDVFPTVARLLGLALPEALPGQDLLGAVASRPAVSETRWGFDGDSGGIRLVAMRTPEWKLIHAPAVGRFEYYDLARDPGERRDVVATSAEARTRIDALRAWERTAPPPPTQEGGDPFFREKLRTLGYVDD